MARSAFLVSISTTAHQASGSDARRSGGRPRMRCTPEAPAARACTWPGVRPATPTNEARVGDRSDVGHGIAAYCHVLPRAVTRETHCRVAIVDPAGTTAVISTRTRTRTLNRISSPNGL